MVLKGSDDGITLGITGFLDIVSKPSDSENKMFVRDELSSLRFSGKVLQADFRCAVIATA
jgi:hypothetical protein